jgi:hypothetical protein
MGDVVLLAGSCAALILVPAGYAWLGARARRRGVSGSLLSPLEELYDPVVHNTQIEIQVEAELPATAPVAGDPPTARDRRPQR